MPPPFYAVTFDLDGVLADSEPWWNQIDAKLLAEHGVTYRGEYHRNVLGVSYRLAVEFYKNALHISASVEELMRRRGEIATDREAMYERFPILGSRRKHAAASLSGGEAQMLAVAMALMARPRLIVLDEPSLGLAPMVVDRIMEEVARLRDTGVSVLLVEQNVRKALKVVDRAYIVSLGVVHMSGTAAEMQGDADVRNAYLGSGGTPKIG